MKKTLYEYKDKIKKLPIKDKYLKNEILIEDFLIDKENNIEITQEELEEYTERYTVMGYSENVEDF